MDRACSVGREAPVWTRESAPALLLERHLRNAAGRLQIEMGLHRAQRPERSGAVVAAVGSTGRSMTAAYCPFGMHASGSVAHRCQHPRRTCCILSATVRFPIRVDAVGVPRLSFFIPIGRSTPPPKIVHAVLLFPRAATGECDRDPRCSPQLPRCTPPRPPQTAVPPTGKVLAVLSLPLSSTGVSSPLPTLLPPPRGVLYHEFLLPEATVPRHHLSYRQP